MKVIPPQSTHAYTVVNLHGRGSNAAEYASEFVESESSDLFNLPATFTSIRWVFPTAPVIRSERFSEDVRQWFDMRSTESPQELSEEQSAQLRGSVDWVKEVVKDEARRVGQEKVFLMGISQGAAVAVCALFELAEEGVCLGGFVGFSTWMPEMRFLDPSSTASIPVFLAHCADDDIINVSCGETLAEFLGSIMPGKVTWRRYENGGHWINEPRGVDDVVEFLKSIVSVGES